MRILLWMLMLLSMVMCVSAYVVVSVGDTGEPLFDIPGDCYAASATDVSGEVYENFGIYNMCDESNSIQFQEDVDLVLGNIQEDEVVVTDTFVYVDSEARPDLDKPAIIYFNRPPYAVEPAVMRDGNSCSRPECNSTYVPEIDRLTVEVSGFSNYSLTTRQDFTVYSDTSPELDNKVYQTIDLGDSNRNISFSCVVQIFGDSLENPGEWVLVQTNPAREVQGKLLGNPDTNQPESLGYFPTVNGVANVYFRDENIVGYSDFEYVSQCMTANGTKLIYEEPISTRYHPFGRSMVARGVWFSDGDNANYLIMAVIVLILLLLLVVKAGKSWFG